MPAMGFAVVGSSVLISLLALVLATLFLCRAIRHRRRLPPGPTGLPIIGNLLQFNPARPHPQFHAWAQQHGAIFHLTLGPQHVVVLNTAEAADTVLTSRAKDYSSRVAPHVAQDVMSEGQRLLFMPYGREWKVVRKAVQSAIGPGPTKRLRQFMDLESITLLQDLLNYEEKTPPDAAIALGKNREGVPEDHWFSFVRRYTTSNVMNVMYGRRAHKIHDNPHLHKIYDVMEQFTQVAQPGRYLADVFPLLRKLPDFLAPWRMEGRKLHDWEMELWGGLLAEHKSLLNTGSEFVRECFMSAYLRARSDSAAAATDEDVDAAANADAAGRGVTDAGWMRDELLAYTGATVLEAGSDTTACALQSFVLFMLAYPHVAAKARAEIDSVVTATDTSTSRDGTGDRLPGFDDEASLPYVVACIKETLRRRPPAVMGVPHRANKDDVYDGYLVPEGATVIGNVWAIHMDPLRYPNPTAFDPDRFYKPGHPTPWGTGPGANGRDHYAFGWGRRFCQGAQITESSLFVVCARMLWAFDLCPLIDAATGVPLVPDAAREEETWTDGFISLPRTFPVRFVPRDEGKARLIRMRYDEIQLEWRALGFAVDER